MCGPQPRRRAGQRPPPPLRRRRYLSGHEPPLFDWDDAVRRPCHCRAGSTASPFLLEAPHPPSADGSWCTAFRVYGIHHRTGMDPRRTGMDPRRTGMDPRRTGMDPGRTGMDPRRTGMDPGRTGMDPRRTGMDPGGRPSGWCTALSQTQNLLFSHLRLLPSSWIVTRRVGPGRTQPSRISAVAACALSD
jgi:hypothetical protein